MRLISLLLLLEFFAPVCNAQVSDDHLKQDLLKLTQALTAGVRTHDTTSLKDILASEFQLTRPNFATPVYRDDFVRNCFG
jgi:hypothetical protein